MAEIRGENTPIPEHEHAEFERKTDLLVFLWEIMGKFLPVQSQQETECTTLSIAIAVIVIYLIAKEGVFRFCTTCSSNSRGILQNFILFLEALAGILIFPPFGWTVLLLWIIGFAIFAKLNHPMIAEVEYRLILRASINVFGFQELVYGGEEVENQTGVPSQV